MGATAARGRKAPACGLLFALSAALLLAPGVARGSTPPAGFRDTVAVGGLVEPTAVKFARDGRVFVAEKRGRVLVYSGLADTTPTVFADLSTNVNSFWDRGLLGLALDPNFPATPFVYVLYTYDAAIGGQAPRWSDGCPNPPGATTGGCVVSGRLSRLQANGDQITGSERVLVEDWCQQFPSHSVGDLEFGPDGALYASAGDGASFQYADHGQNGDPCGDPNQEGGALRSQDLRTASDPLGLDGTIVRIEQPAGANPGAPEIVAHGFRNPFRIEIRPGTSELWIGDVGWDAVEEVDRLFLATDEPVRNYGWPCYEGQSIDAAYQEQGLPICAGLYSSPGAVTPPFFAYQHGASVVPGPGCVLGGSSIAGLAFYQGSSYPGYGGALFLADYARNCIWAMKPNAEGIPDPATRAAFVLDAASPVDLEIGPNGDLFYVSFAGAVRRIEYRPAVAVAKASPLTGPAPLTVQFDGTESTDSDGGHNLTYAWDFDENGSVDSTASAPTHTFAQGSYTVGLRVTDQKGSSGSTSVLVSAGNTPPEATITLPAAGTSWRVADTVSFSGSATDSQDGVLPASRLTWKAILHHCPASCHDHPLQSWAGVAAGTFPAPDHDYPSYLELELTATDLDGLTDTTSVSLQPTTVLLHFLTQPGGLNLTVGSTTQIAPFDRTVIVGSQTSITAPSPQGLLLFSAWSDGGARSHTFFAPTATTTYTASFAPSAPPQPPPPAPPPTPRPPALVECVVPRLIGRPLSRARRVLTGVHCRLGRVAWVYSATPKGHVRTQNPRAGRRLANRAKVALVVSRGRRAK